MEFMKNNSYLYFNIFTYVAICSLPAIRIVYDVYIATRTSSLCIAIEWIWLEMHSKFHVVCCGFLFDKLKFNQFYTIRCDAWQYCISRHFEPPPLGVSNGDRKMSQALSIAKHCNMLIIKNFSIDVIKTNLKFVQSVLGRVKNVKR